jgi:hypothetical protein
VSCVVFYEYVPSKPCDRWIDDVQTLNLLNDCRPLYMNMSRCDIPFLQASILSSVNALPFSTYVLHGTTATRVATTQQQHVYEYGIWYRAGEMADRGELRRLKAENRKQAALIKKLTADIAKANARNDGKQQGTTAVATILRARADRTQVGMRRILKRERSLGEEDLRVQMQEAEIQHGVAQTQLLSGDYFAPLEQVLIATSVPYNEAQFEEMRRPHAPDRMERRVGSQRDRSGNCYTVSLRNAAQQPVRGVATLKGTIDSAAKVALFPLDVFMEDNVAAHLAPSKYVRGCGALCVRSHR